ncbi:MAG: SDR family oxidoreductase [Polyangiaceae bacterium]|nr:SDR family oxidoreductase [Polyangiaceae bacterium]
MHDKQVALITGANKGIGLQIAKELAARGFTVLVGSRDPARGEAAAKTIADDARAVAIDVTDGKSVAAAAEHIRTKLGRLDVLVNNAGIAQTGKPGRTLEAIVNEGRASVASLDDVRAIFETNVFGVIAVSQAMLPLLREAPVGRIVNVSSSVGSLTRNADPGFPYRRVFGVSYAPSKTALNAITLSFALELESTRIKVNACCPGFTATDLNNFQGTRSVQEGARSAVRLALLGADGPTGTFSDDEGVIPW